MGETEEGETNSFSAQKEDGLHRIVRRAVEASGGDFKKEITQLSLRQWYEIKAASIQLAMDRLNDGRKLLDVIKSGAQDIKLTDEDLECGYHSWRYITGRRLNDSEKKSFKELPVWAKAVKGLAGLGMRRGGRLLRRYDRAHDKAIAGEFKDIQSKQLPANIKK